jgi:hypothetical protein
MGRPDSRRRHRGARRDRRGSVPVRLGGPSRYNTFFGDEQHMLVRSMCLRHLWLGSPISLEALFDVFDWYGQTSYLNMIAHVQLLVDLRHMAFTC